MVYKGILVRFMGKNSDLTDGDYARIASWGLNVVYFFVWWYRIEPNEDSPEVYSEENLLELEKQINMARAHGLQPMIGMQVSWGINDSQPWHGWSSYLGSDYANMNDEGRMRFYKMLLMLGERFPDVIFCPWHFPYHKETVTEERRTMYSEVTFPDFRFAIRKHNMMPIIYSPPHQGNRDGLNTGEYLTQKVFGDPIGILYNVNSHDGDLFPVCCRCQSWNGDVERLREHWKPALDFKEANNIDLICIENIALQIHGDCATRPIDPLRLEWDRATHDIERKNNVSFVEHSYENPPFWSSPIEADGSDNAVAEILKEYAITPIPSIVEYTLTIKSTPIEGIPFKIDETEGVTPSPVSLPEGIYLVAIPSEADRPEGKYNFKQWENGSNNPERVIKLTQNTEITATYALPEPPPPEKGYLAVHAFSGEEEVKADGRILETKGKFETPVTLELDPGTYHVEATFRFRPKVKTTVVTLHQTSRLDFNYRKPLRLSATFPNVSKIWGYPLLSRLEDFKREGVK